MPEANPYLETLQAPAATGAGPGNPYLDLLQSAENLRKTQTAAAVSQAVGTNPDEFAKQKRVAAYLGYPLAAVAAMPDITKRQAQAQQVQQDIAASPVLQQRFTDADFARLAHDDTGVLSSLASAIGYLVSAPGRGNTLMGDIGAGVARGAQGAAGVFQAGAELPAPLLDWLEPVQAVGGNPLRRLAEGFATQGATAARTAERLSPPQAGTLAGGVSSGVQSFTTNALALPLALFPGGQGAALSMMTAQTGGQSYQQAREQGLPMSQALPFAASQAAIEYATEKIPLARLIGDVKASTPFFQTLAKQAALEVPGEQIATVLQDMNEWAVLPENAGKTFSEYLAARPNAAAQTLIATLVGTGGNVTLTHALAKTFEGHLDGEAQQAMAQQDAEQLKRVFDVAAQSALRERDPEGFATLVQELADEAPDAPKEVRFDGRQFAETLQQSGLPEEELRAMLPTAFAQLDEAMATGGEVTVPVGEFSKVIGTPLDAALMQHARIGDNELSQAESKQAGEQAAALLKSEAERVAAQAGDEAAQRVAAESVKTNVLDQLNTAGRFTPDVNNAYASLVRDFYVTMAGRLKTTPDELFKQFPLTVRAEGVGALAQGDVLDLGDLSSLMGAELGGTQNNASGESAASLEAQSRLAEEKARDRPRYVIDTRTGAVRPLVGVDAVDTNAKAGQVIVQKNVGAAEWTVLSAGPDVTRAGALAAVGRGRASGALQQSGLQTVATMEAMPVGPVVVDPVGFAPGKATYRETSVDGLNDLLLDDNRQTVRQMFVTDNADLAIGQGDNKGVAIEFRPDALSGAEHKKPGTGNAAGREYRTDMVAARAIASFTAPKGFSPKQLRKLAQSALRNFDAQTLPDGRVKYTRKGLDTLAQGPRGTFNPAALNITLLQDADLSTFLHETGHFFLDMLWRFASDPQAPADVQTDMAAVLKWFKTTPEQWAAWTEQYNATGKVPAGMRKLHERFAEGFEQYLLEGKAPSIELQPLFSKFRSWLLNVYKSLKDFLAGRGEAAGPAGALGQSARDQTETPEFKRWFGKSKVVDENGKPLVVYHGTRNKFTTFDYSKIGDNGRAEGAGFYFTNNEQVASGYGEPLKVFLSIKKPLAYDAKGFSRAVVQKIVRRIAEREAEADGGDIADGFLSNFGDVRSEGLNSVVRQAADAIAADQTAVDQLSGIVGSGVNAEHVNRATFDVTGHDGVVAEGFSNSGDTDNRIFVAFFPEQIKSATDNRGTFDPNDPSILAQANQKTPLGLTDEVRGVFDRLLASQEQIARAEALRSFDPLKVPGMAPAERAGYEAAGAKATDKALDTMSARSVRDMRWLSNARSKALKALQQDAAAKRKEVEAEVRAEVAKEPVRQAIRWLRKGEMTTAEGEQIRAEKGFRLNTEALAEMYPESMLARPDLEKLKGLTAGNGLHPDVVAGMFGFSSGDELVRSVIDAEPEASVVEGMADQRMLERYGDLATEAGMQRAADEAVHNEARGRFLATGLKALQDAQAEKQKTPRGGSVSVMVRAAKDFAAQLVARRKVRELRAGQHTAAEARAGKAAQKALTKGDVAGAITAQRDQLLNHYAARETYAALDEVDKALAYLKKFEKDGVRKKLPPEYLDQIDKLLERVELRQRTQRELDKRAKLTDWIKSQEELGIEVQLPPEVAEDVQLTNYQDMTLEAFRGLVDTVKQVEHLGRLKSKLLTAKDQREFDAIKDSIVSSILANSQGRTADSRTPTTNLGRALAGIKNFGAAHIKVATWARIMDGGKDGGPVWEYLVRPANAAGDQETTMLAKATQDLAKILAPVLARGKMGGAGTFFPSINRSMNREAVLAVALNTGNESNLQRLLDGEGWTADQIKPMLDTLTPEDWKAVQAVWDYFESYRPLIAAKERRVFGTEPEWIEPGSAVAEAYGVKGGYYPVKYDPQASQRAEEHADAEGAKRQIQGAYGAATTRRSFTKARVDQVFDRPLLYTLQGVYSGVTDVIHDLAWHEWLIDANRLLKNKSIDAAIRNTYGTEVVRQFKSWRDDIADGGLGPQRPLDSALGYLRQSVSVAGLGFNVVSAMMQPLGLVQSIQRVGAKWVARGVWQTIGDPVQASKAVNEKSAFMANRARTRFRELNELRNRVQGQSALKRAVSENAYFLMMAFQRLVDVPTWQGAYERAISEGNDEARAVALADQAVIDAQGNGQTKDLAAIERGPQALKLFTTFYSFMNTSLNLGVASKMSPGSRAKFAADMLLLYVVPAVLGSVLKDAFTPGDAGDDEELAKKLAGEQLSYLLGLVVLGREFGQAGRMLTGANAHDYTGPAGLRAIADSYQFAKQFGQGEFDDAFRKAAVNLAGDLLGLPSAQINRTITGVKALSEGKTQNPAAAVLGYQEPR